MGWLGDIGHWFGKEAHDVGDWAGREWHNTEKWLPEIGAGAALAASAVFAPYLLPEEATAFGGLFGGGAAAAEGLGAAELGAGAADLGATSAAADLGAGAAVGSGGGELGLGASAVDTAIGSTGPMGIGATDLVGGSVAADPTWGTSVAAAVDPLAEPPPANIFGGAGGSEVPMGEGEILGGDAATGQAPQFADPNAPHLGDFTTTVNPEVSTGSVGAPTSGSDVLSQTFGPDYGSSITNAESNVAQGNALGRTVDPTAGGAGGPLRGLVGDNFLGNASWTDLAKYGIPLGYLGYTALRGPDKIPPQAQDAQRIAQQEAQVGSEQLSAAAAGRLTSPMESNIAIYIQNATNQLRQQYASAGQDWQHNTGYLQGVQQIMQQADAMREKYIEMEFNNAIRLDGQATQTMMQVARMQFDSDKQFQDALTAAMKALGMAAVGGGGGINLKLAS